MSRRFINSRSLRPSRDDFAGRCFASARDDAPAEAVAHGTPVIGRALRASVDYVCPNRKRSALPGATQAVSARRRGVSIVEMIATAMLIGVAMTAALPLLGQAGVQSRTADQYLIAQLEVANVMERIAVDPRRELRELGDASAVTISGTAGEHLPDARLQVHAADLPGPPASLRVAVELSWTDLAGEKVGPVRLVKWFFPANTDPGPERSERNR